MSKEQLKETYAGSNGKVCALCGLPIEGEYYLYDTDRINPKANGGDYAEGNYRIAHPGCHMRRHGTYRERVTLIEELKAIIDDRVQIMKMYNKVNNQLKAYERRTDVLNKGTLDFLELKSVEMKSILTDRGKTLKKLVQEIAKTDQLAKSALGVKGVGEITVGYCLSYINLEKARHASSLWSYCGLDKPSHSRYEKNVAGGGNKSLRTQLYTMAESQMKGKNNGSGYGFIYDWEKAKKENSTEIVKSRNRQGKLIEVEWKGTMPSHRHAHALRMVIKHFLADYWYVGRTILGLPTTAIYAEAVLKSGHRMIMPEERGWIYREPGK